MANIVAESIPLTLKRTERYLSLDVLRGLTVALMVIVNTPGSWSTIYAPLRHAPWHGFTVTDLVFPAFLFAVGNAMSFSMRKFDVQPESVFLTKVLKRTAIIFFIGLLLRAFPFMAHAEGGGLELFDFSTIRVMGVLQRIALAYLIGSLVVHYFKIKGAVIFSAVVLLGYWAVLYFFGNQPDPYSLEGNAALKFDLLFFSPEVLYKGYGIPFDPEGLLSTLPAAVNVVAGYLVGMFIQKNGNNLSTVFKLNLAGAAVIVVALLWDVAFPINKALWTSSYTLYTVGLVILVLGALMLVIEVFNSKKWTYFFEVFGKNPLFIYAMSILVIKTLSFIKVDEETRLSSWIYQNWFLSWGEGEFASLMFALAYMLLHWQMGYLMDRNRIYVKV
ncbi:acyltransferase family protein [Pontibacter anaerobius]|uniref:Heparan-alpha-glucosaminide N-acetyltransferase domain-containing protein n=1 Tax=Pontibacter anaerobius TaxID=2993940 RepID=A0ABT3RFA1_9BACT|nr:heparan-alpha-glucosaminide N-acetyltransferase domain-containing protein [Pontibacter anaerobius]MCX2740262.1 heparan-alpha-glucosaminide N-acetyltransferase domain-containing protein [Pontibacter anaerobius]